MPPSLRLTVSIDAHWWHLLTSRQITNAQFNLIQVITNYSDPNDGWCRLTVKQMATVLGLKSQANVRGSLTSLEQAGHLKKKTKNKVQVWRKLVVQSIAQKYSPKDGLYLSDFAPPLIYPPLESFLAKAKKDSPASKAGGRRRPLKDSVMLFDELEETSRATIPEEAYIIPAKKLYEALSTIADRTPQRNAWRRWVDDFRKLHELDNISLDRINATMDWLTAPKEIKRTAARSGKMFRSMFTQLESMMDVATRSANKQEPVINPRAKKRARDLYDNFYKSTRLSLTEVEHFVARCHEMEAKLVPSMEAAKVKPFTLNGISNTIGPLLRNCDVLLSQIVTPLRKWPDWNGKITKQMRESFALAPGSTFRICFQQKLEPFAMAELERAWTNASGE